MKFALLLAVMVMVAGFLARRRIRTLRRPDITLTDDLIRQIEERGRIEHEVPEPLDLGEIREEEERFWDQTWDEPEPL